MKKMKLLAGILISSLILAVAGCSQVNVQDDQASNAPSTAKTTTTAADNTDTSETTEATIRLSGTLTLTGSTSMSDVSNALAESFMLENPDVTISVGGNGSGEGPTAVNDGTAQIGLLSRGLKDSENPDGFDQYIIGYDGIAVIVNSESEIKDLTLEQVARIYKGEITNWSEVGGKDAPIHAIGREAASGTRGAFEEIVDAKDECKYTEEQNSTGSVKQSVTSNPNAIGYISLSAVDETVHAVSLNGVAPSIDTVKSGDYELQRPFLMITAKSTDDALTKAFMDYVYSAAGMQIIADDGVVPNS